jgi:hypothetical protein
MSVRDFPDIDVAQCHYNDTLKRKPFEVRLLINALLREGSIVKLDTDREGGPLYAMPDYVEASEKRYHSDQRLYRNYGGQIYDSPARTDDV